MEKKAIAIEALLVWAYREQRVDLWWAGRKGLMPLEAAVEAAVPVPHYDRRPLEQELLDAELGRDAKRSRLASSLTPEDMPPDALALHRLVLKLPREAMVLAVLHARRGDRPDQLERGARYAPADGWAVVEGWRARLARAADGARLAKSQIHPKTRWPWLTWVRWSPDPRDVLAARTLYDTWRDGLATLLWYLTQSPELLRDHAVGALLPEVARPLQDFERDYCERADALGALQGQPLASRHVVPGDIDIGEIGVKRRRWTAE